MSEAIIWENRGGALGKTHVLGYPPLTIHEEGCVGQFVCCYPVTPLEHLNLDRGAHQRQVGPVDRGEFPLEGEVRGVRGRVEQIGG